MDRNKYYLKASWQDEYSEVSKEEYIKAEQSAGFRSKFGDGHIATAAFDGGSVRGQTWEPVKKKTI